MGQLDRGQFLWWLGEIFNEALSSSPEGPAQVDAEAALGVIAIAGDSAAVDADDEVASHEEVDARFEGQADLRRADGDVSL